MPDMSNSYVLTLKDKFRVDIKTEDGVTVFLNRLNLAQAVHSIFKVGGQTKIHLRKTRDTD